MRDGNLFGKVICCLVACGAAFSALNEVKADIVYSFTGILDTAANLDPAMPGDTFTYEFVIDDTVLDSDADPLNGEYVGAIISSSINIANFPTNDDFATGTVIVNPATINFIHPTNPALGFGFNPTVPFTSDSLIQPIDGSGVQFFVVSDQGGNLGIGTGGLNAVPEPTAFGLLAIGLGIVSLRRKRC